MHVFRPVGVAKIIGATASSKGPSSLLAERCKHIPCQVSLPSGGRLPLLRPCCWLLSSHWSGRSRFADSCSPERGPLRNRPA